MNEFDPNATPELTLPGAAPELKLAGETFSAPVMTPIANQITATEKDLDDSMLSEEDKLVVKEFSQKIDIRNSNMILMYGSEAQKNISAFSEMALNKVRTKDMGEVGGMLTGLVTELQGFSFNEEQPKGIKKFFKKGSNAVATLKARYDSVEKNVDRISRSLEAHKIQLMKDISMLDQMYQMNLSYYKELTMYILAGKQRLADVRENELEPLRRKAHETGLTEDAQAANDLANLCDRFEKKIHDLDLTRTVSIQMAPQIRLVQNNDSMMAEKIQSSIINTIPLWKNQMVLALGIHHSREAMEAQRAVTDITNDLLKQNADALKQGTIETAREAERGIVDIETLQHTNQALISTLDEVLNIQQEGRQKREAAEVELRRIENELKGKLLEIRG